MRFQSTTRLCQIESFMNGWVIVEISGIDRDRSIYLQKRRRRRRRRLKFILQLGKGKERKKKRKKEKKKRESICSSFFHSNQILYGSPPNVHCSIEVSMSGSTSFVCSFLRIHSSEFLSLSPFILCTQVS